MAQTKTDKKKAILNLETLEARTLFAGAGEVVDQQVDVDIMDFDIDDLFAEDEANNTAVDADVDVMDLDIDDLLGDDESNEEKLVSKHPGETAVKAAKKFTEGHADKTDSEPEKCTNRKSYQRHRDHLNAGIVRDFTDKPGDPCFKEAKGDFIKEDMDWATLYTWGLMAKYKTAKTKPF